MSNVRAIAKKWALNEECFARYREDGLLYRAQILDVTGDTYTVVFIDYGNDQPATPADCIFADASGAVALDSSSSGLLIPNLADVELEVDREDELCVTPHLKLASATSLADLDSLIATKDAHEPQPAPRCPLPPSLPPQASGAPPPPPPPPPPLGAPPRSRVDMAAELLGVGAPPAPAAAAAADSGPFFGVDLKDLCARDGSAIPRVLRDAAAELRKRCLQEGIFRIPGRAQVVSQLVDAADKGQLGDLHKYDTSDIASFLKKFFALLPTPVIPGDLVDRFGQKFMDAKAQCLELRQIVEQGLPADRVEALTFILELLHDISRHAEQNKMTSTNLATIFLPALFFAVQSDVTSPEEIMKMAVLGKTVSATLAFMIDNPRLDPATVQTSAAAAPRAAATIAVGSGSGSSSSGGSRRSSASPKVDKARGADKARSRRSSFTMGGSASSDSGKKNVRESLSVSSPANERARSRNSSGSLSSACTTELTASGEAKLSAEMVLAAMRSAKSQLVRRAGAFGAGSATWTGRRGWLSMGRKRFWCLIVNDWLYWFPVEHANLDNQAALASALVAFTGNLWMARCNVMCKGERDVYIVQPSGANLALVADNVADADDWMVALQEISIVAFPLPLRAGPTVLAARAEWVSVKGQQLFAVVDIDKRALLLCRDETRTKVVRSVALHQATVAKGVVKSKGGAGFVVADAVGRVVIDTHNVTDWVAHLKDAIVVCWALEHEPDTIRSMRKP